MISLPTLLRELPANLWLRKALGHAASVLAALMIVSFVIKNGGRHYYLQSLLKPNAGEAEALPELVYQGIDLARAHQLGSVNLGPGIWESPELYHRFGEGLYPIRLDRKSAFLLVGPKDQPGSSCQTLDQRPLVRLVKCQ